MSSKFTVEQLKQVADKNDYDAGYMMALISVSNLANEVYQTCKSGDDKELYHIGMLGLLAAVSTKVDIVAEAALYGTTSVQDEARSKLEAALKDTTGTVH